MEYMYFDNYTELPLNVTTTEKPYYHYDEYIVGTWIGKVVYPILLTMGLPGNILTFLVMMMAHNRQKHYCRYLAALVVSDTSVLLLCGAFWIGLMFERDLSSGDCHIIALFFYWFSTNSTYMIVCLATERFICVHNISTTFFAEDHPNRSTKIIVSLIAVTLLLNIPQYFLAQPATPHSYACGLFSESNMDIAWQLYNTVHAIVFSLIPILAVFIMNIRIIQKVFRQGDNICLSRAERNYTLMLLILSFLFLVTILPQFIRHVVYTYVHHKGNPEFYAMYILFFNITHMLYLVNNSINFYLYCATVADFREDIRLLCTCRGQDQMLLLN